MCVGDAADAIVRSAELVSVPQPMNIGTGKELSIKWLASVIAAAVGYEGEIVWNSTMPGGQKRRCLGMSRAMDLLDWKAQVDLNEGLKRTLEWDSCSVH